MNCLAKIIGAASMCSLGAAFYLNQQPDLEDLTSVPVKIQYTPAKQERRKAILSKAETLIGQPYFSEKNPRGLSCIDVYVRSAEGFEEKLRQDYRGLPEPQKRYSGMSLRLPLWVANAKKLVDSRFENTPENPYFARRIQNVVRFQQAQGLFFRSRQATPQAGMVVYWVKGKNKFPTHASVIAEVRDGKVAEVIHASTVYGKVVKCDASVLWDKGHKIYGFGDAP